MPKTQTVEKTFYQDISEPLRAIEDAALSHAARMTGDMRGRLLRFIGAFHAQLSEIDERWYLPESK